MVAAKGQITARMAECSNSLQKIQDSLLRLSGSEVSTVLTELKVGALSDALSSGLKRSGTF